MSPTCRRRCPRSTRSAGRSNRSACSRTAPARPRRAAARRRRRGDRMAETRKGHATATAVVRRAVATLGSLVSRHRERSEAIQELQGALRPPGSPRPFGPRDDDQARRKRIGPVSRAVIALIYRFVPRNFGVDLEPVDRRASLRAAMSPKSLRAALRALLLTRLDRSGARIRLVSLAMFAAYAAIGVKLVVLGVSHDPPQTLKGAADQAVSGAGPTSSTATAKCSRPTSRPCRSSPSRTTSSTWTRRSNS